MTGKKTISLFVLLSLLCVPLLAEDGKTFTPEPYKDEEFAPWLHDLRRAEILLIGSVPLTLFFSNLTYGLIRYGQNGFQEDYAPSLFGNQNPEPMTQEEKIGVIVAAVSVSAAIALTDFIIGKIVKSKENAEE